MNMERLDRLPNGWPIWQCDDQFKFTMDAVLLAAFPYLKKGQCVMELGSGTGAVSLLLAARGCTNITGIDINLTATQLFARSITINGLDNKIKAIGGDIKKIKELFRAGDYGLVVANPPYRRLGHGRLRQGAAETACHEGFGETIDFIKAARYLLKYSGRFALVHLPERLPEIMGQCTKEGLEPKRLQMVHSFSNKPPVAFLLEAIYGAKPGLKVLPPFFVYEKKEQYSSELISCYQSF